MRDADEEIREIKKEIIESRGLIIKTNNLTNSLAADIKSIAKRQVGYERRFNWNSAAAYVLFATLSFVGLKLASDARISEIESEKEGLTRQARELRSELVEQTAATEERDRAESRANAFYVLIRQQKRAEVVAGYDAVAKEKLSRAEAAFFRDAVERFRRDLSVAASQQGLGLMRTGRFAEAAEKFQESMQLNEDGAHIPSVKYNLARALRRLGRQSEALVYIRHVSDQTIDRDLHDDAVWLLSLCAEELDDINTARDALRSYLRRWPRSSLAVEARARLRGLNVRAMRSSGG
ncbi:MAG: tetratricopeptide repeat protein [Myxococcota bacterium]